MWPATPITFRSTSARTSISSRRQYISTQRFRPPKMDTAPRTRSARQSQLQQAQQPPALQSRPKSLRRSARHIVGLAPDPSQNSARTSIFSASLTSSRTATSTSPPSVYELFTSLAPVSAPTQRIAMALSNTLLKPISRVI